MINATRISVNAQLEPWAMAEPFSISGFIFDDLQLLRVTISDGHHVGVGEAAGVYYRSETPATMLKAVEDVRDEIADGISRRALLDLLPPGGARNAVDCALWEFESVRQCKPIWQLAGLPTPRPLTTTMTIGAGSPNDMARSARTTFPNARALKLKLLGDGLDGERVSAVRRARDDAWLGVDANQCFTPATLALALPHFVAARVAMIEQPFAIGDEHLLDDLNSPISIAVDESAQCIDDLEGLVGRAQVINIKLDKCGGLTAALLMAVRARELGFQVMVGSMPGTSLAIAPAFIVGQLCDVVDLDAPLHLSRDRDLSVIYRDGMIEVPSGLWGWAK